MVAEDILLHMEAADNQVLVEGDPLANNQVLQEVDLAGIHRGMEPFQVQQHRAVAADQDKEPDSLLGLGKAAVADILVVNQNNSFLERG